MNGIALILHLVAINIWIGGPFFATVILGRAIKNVETHEQLILWQLIFRRFFFWAWVAVGIILVSGAWMIYHIYGGISLLPLHVKLMGGIALTMIFVFLFIYLFPYRQFKGLLEAEDVDGCIRKLAVIRFASVINIILGISIVVVIGGGPYFLY